MRLPHVGIVESRRAAGRARLVPDMYVTVFNVRGGYGI